jgi:hypothetical protein
VRAHERRRAAEARLAEAIGLAASIGVAIVHTAILPLRERRPSTLMGEGQVSALKDALEEQDVGVVVVEVVFVYPGMGQYLVDHVSKRDVPVVQACGLLFAAVYIGMNLVADVVSILANPRLRHPK